MLSIHNLSKNFGIQPILQNINFNISAGERIGLIGPNGSGKTTLMRILAGFEQPDSGDVASTRLNLRVGYLAQGMDFTPEQTLRAALGLDPTTQTDPAADVESLASPSPKTQTTPPSKHNTTKPSPDFQPLTFNPKPFSPLLGLPTSLSTPPSPISAADKRLA